MGKMLKTLVPVIVGLVATNFPAISDFAQNAVAGHPKLAIVVGSVIAALTYAMKSPWVQHEIQDLKSGE